MSEGSYLVQLQSLDKNPTSRGCVLQTGRSPKVRYYNKCWTYHWSGFIAFHSEIELCATTIIKTLRQPIEGTK